MHPPERDAIALLKIDADWDSRAHETRRGMTMPKWKKASLSEAKRDERASPENITMDSQPDRLWDLRLLISRSPCEQRPEGVIGN
jgi:hypothetical protein